MNLNERKGKLPKFIETMIEELGLLPGTIDFAITRGNVWPEEDSFGAFREVEIRVTGRIIVKDET
jgi:hypothetical protein